MVSETTLPVDLASGLPLTHVIVQATMNANRSDEWINVQTVEVNGKDISLETINVTGLQPSMTYRFRLLGENVLGQGQAGVISQPATLVAAGTICILL